MVSLGRRSAKRKVKKQMGQKTKADRKNLNNPLNPRVGNDGWRLTEGNQKATKERPWWIQRKAGKRNPFRNECNAESTQGSPGTRHRERNAQSPQAHG